MPDQDQFAEQRRVEDDRSTLFECSLRGTAFHEQHPWLFRWSPLLFTVFWILDSANASQHEHHWIGLCVFYAVFLLAYLRTFAQGERCPRFWLAVLFVIGYAYLPFNRHIAGECVFPVAMSVYFLRQPTMQAALRVFALIEVLSCAAIALEVRLLHASPAMSSSVIFYMVAIGLSNFAYSRHMLASEQLERANAEIEHLAQVAERERIARDLHDLLGHTLTVIVLKSDVANRLFRIDPELAHREIAEVEATARKALTEVREAVAGYRAEGVPTEVAQARRALASAGVQLTTNVEPLILTEDEETTVCLMLREAVTNVIRHARATVCRLEMQRDGSLLRMSVEDNGSGGTNAEGNGLRGMRERFSRSGGTMLRQQGRDGGTRLVAELPLRAGKTDGILTKTDAPPAVARPVVQNEGLVQI